MELELYVSTFGNFDISIGNESLLQETNRSYRLFKLFQYFITGLSTCSNGGDTSRYVLVGKVIDGN